MLPLLHLTIYPCCMNKCSNNKEWKLTTALKIATNRKIIRYSRESVAYTVFFAFHTMISNITVINIVFFVCKMKGKILRYNPSFRAAVCAHAWLGTSWNPSRPHICLHFKSQPSLCQCFRTVAKSSKTLQAAIQERWTPLPPRRQIPRNLNPMNGTVRLPDRRSWPGIRVLLRRTLVSSIQFTFGSVHLQIVWIPMGWFGHRKLDRAVC